MHYTYAHYKPNGELFYIGKGTIKRAYAKDNRNLHWRNTVNKHGGFEVKLLARWEKEVDALEHEKFLIKIFREMGFNLVNITDGGEGVSGYKHSEETLAKLRKFQKEFQNSEKMKTVRKQNNENYASDPHRRKVQSEKIKELMKLPENRERSRIGALKQNADPSFREAQSNRMKNRWQSDAFENQKKKCRCVETGQVFDSISDARRFFGSSIKISEALSGKRETAGGYHWELVELENNNGSN